MRKNLACLLSVTLACAAAACGDDDESLPDAAGSPDGAPPPDAAPPDASPPDAAPPDAPPAPMADAGVYDFSCVGAPDDTTAPDPLTVAGTVTNFVGMSAIADVTVEALRRADDALLATAQTDVMGAFSLTAANPGGMAVDGYLRFSKATYATTYLYPPEPLGDNVSNLDAGMIAASMLGPLYSLAGAPSYDPAQGTAVVAVLDCAGTPIAGATVALNPPAADMGYLNGMFPSSSAMTTDGSGIAFGFNVPPGDSTVSADYLGTPLESHTFAIHADSISVTVIHP